MNITKFFLVGLASLFMIFSFTFLSYTDGLFYEIITNESRGVELLTALFYIISGVVLIMLSYRLFKSNQETSRKLILPVLLGLFFIVVGGEEESWGQWIFEFSTPETLKEVNFQNEVNFHNLEVFTGSMHAQALLYRFILLYAIILPFAYLMFGWVRTTLDRIGCPVIPVYLTPIFASAFIFRHLALKTPFPPESEVWRHAEVVEFFFAVGFLAFCIDRVMKYKSRGV